MLTAPTPTRLSALVLGSGLAALSWQVLWQHKAALALGVSALGTAITLATLMAGLCLGALGAGRVLAARATVRPLRIYAGLELLIGLAGLLLVPAFAAIAALDTQLYRATPELAPLAYLASMALVLGVPAVCMGATLPVFGLMARQWGGSLSWLYGLNTLGAAVGALVCAFALVPWLGVQHTIYVVAGINFVVAVVAWVCDKGAVSPAPENAAAQAADSTNTIAHPYLLVAVTGLVTFILEVAWFRSIVAGLGSTTYAFALMVSAVLIGLGVGAALAPFLRALKLHPAHLLGTVGVLVFAFSPLLERFDSITLQLVSDHAPWFVLRSLLTLALLIGLPMMLLGAVLPGILDAQHSPRRWSALYAFNSFCSVVGSLAAAWLLLPVLGVVKTTWLAGAVLVLLALALHKPGRVVLLGCAVAAAFSAYHFNSGVGTERVQSLRTATRAADFKVFAAHDGPEATVSVLGNDKGGRILVIDGFEATAEGVGPAAHYMIWMGHLPMLAHPNPQQALVICFGTGQTANAVRREGPQALDIVDINARVLSYAPFFPSNEGVLQDPRVHARVMDGRAYIRRTDKRYDVITLEPMPPTFAGVNALYSREFYEQAKAKLTPQGIVAQWLPFHLIPADYTRSVVRSFQAVFPNAVLWVDPRSRTGIILGSADDTYPLGTSWPGFARQQIDRTLSEAEVTNAVVLNRTQLEAYLGDAPAVTDDNQLLSYGPAVAEYYRYNRTTVQSLKDVNSFAPADRQISLEPAKP